MIEKLLESSSNFVGILREIEEADGVLSQELEKRFDIAVKDMAKTTDSFANSLDYLDVAIEIAKKRKDKYISKMSKLNNLRLRMRSDAKALILSGLAFEGNERSVKLNNPIAKIDYTNIDIDNLDSKYVRIKKEIKKKELSKDIMSGEIMPDGVLVSEERILSVR